jgi:hypothetical protein
MEALLRLNGAVRRDPAIEAWFGVTDPFRLIVRPWFTHIRKLGTDVREVFHDGCPTACVGDAPFAYVGAYKAHANLGFFYGAALPDPQKFLHGTGVRMRHIKLHLDDQPEDGAINALIAAAYDDIKRRLA